MKPPVDLHIHSNYSDGLSTVSALCALAERSGVQTFALSDHDTTDGLNPIQSALEEVSRDVRPIDFIPAIELSSGDDGLTHVLGYGIRPGAEPLESELTALRRKRAERSLETLELLDRLLGTELAKEIPSGERDAEPVLGRMHAARLLVQRGVVRTLDEAFQRYLGVGKPAYLPLRHIATEEAIRILSRSGAVPVLAHPVRIGFLYGEPGEKLARLKAAGLMGVEVFHPSASNPDVRRLYELAREYGMLVTGGSDFHGDWGIRSKIGQYPPGWQTWEQDLNALCAAIAAGVSHTEGDC